MTEPTTADRIRALTLLEAADHLRDAHFRDGMSVLEIGTALRNTADDADPMVGSLARDGYGLNEIAAMLAEPAVPSVPADTDLRERVAAALFEYSNPGFRWIDASPHDRAAFSDDASAFLAVLPAPADRAAVLREAADLIEGHDYDPGAVEPVNVSAFTFAELLRRAADDAQQDSGADASDLAMVCRECLAPVIWVDGANGGWWNHTVPAEDGHSIVPKPLLRTASRMADEAQQADRADTLAGEPFVYTDADAAQLTIAAHDDGGRPVVSVVADEGVYVLPEDIEHVVAALRDARRNVQAMHDEALQAGENR
ncbi:hypothetical protein ACFVWR_18330 [Leifsonia sp. NPDC058292]|uniref:hypothetical protein n=1 Tax=Leifsonia sp. NPDC058292 TaxID=3346428 RepID=UPI0036DF6452